MVAKLVGRSEKLVGERLDLLRLPGEAQALLGERRVPLACAPALIRIAEGEALLADLCAAWLTDRPSAAARFPAAAGEVVDDVLEAEWQADDGQPLHPVAYSVGSWHGPIVSGGRSREELLPRILAKLAECGEGVRAAYAALPAIAQVDEYDWQARQAVEHRERECFALDDEDADAARAFGCLLDLSGPDGREHLYVTDREWLADRLCQRIAAHATAERERKEREREARTPSSAGDGSEREARREQRQRDYEARVAGRARNLDLGAALARWQPKLDTDTVKLLGSLVLLHYGKAAAWAHRLCVEQSTTTNKQGTVSVRYPRAQAETELHREASERLSRARTAEDAVAVVLRLLVAQRLVDTEGLPGADRQGVYEPQELAASKVLEKLARRVAPASVKRHLAEQVAERERREQEWREEQAAKLAEQRAALAAGQSVRCACCLEPITTPDEAAEKHGSLVHRGDCEQEWGSGIDQEEAT
jgi:hypothetical protein